MGTARRVTGWSIAVAGVTAVVLATASGAAASAHFNFQTRTGFISRGTAIAAVGKAGLVANPMVAYQETQNFTETCTWADGTSVQASGSHFLFLLFQAETRYAGNSGKIKGYRFSPADIVDGETSDPGEDRALCWAARGLPDDGSAITQTYQLGPEVETLSLNGVDVRFHSH
jgi:hypothetical protein